MKEDRLSRPETVFPFGDYQPGTALSEARRRVAARCSRRRARRRLAAGALGLVLVAAVATLLLVPAGHPAPGAAGFARLSLPERLASVPVESAGVAAGNADGPATVAEPGRPYAEDGERRAAAQPRIAVRPTPSARTASARRPSPPLGQAPGESRDGPGLPEGLRPAGPLAAPVLVRAWKGDARVACSLVKLGESNTMIFISKAQEGF